MTNSLTGGELSLEKVFSDEYIFEIPCFQRPYAWTTEEAETLFDDLYAFFKSEEKSEEVYFLGSIVLIKKDAEPAAMVVDGQQRLTTLTILFSAIVSLFDSAENKAEARGYIWASAKPMAQKKEGPRLKLRERDGDKDFFEEYIQSGEFSKLPESNPKIDSQKNIKANGLKIFEKLKEKFKEDKALEKFFTFLIKRCILVVVKTPSEKAAFRVFSVMNTRGLDLLTCDIVKSRIIEDIDAGKRGLCSRNWESLENNLGRDEFNNLFGHIRMIYACTKAKKSILEEFEELVLSAVENKDREKFINKTLSPFCDAYDAIKNCDYKAESVPEETKKAINDNLRWINQIDNSDWIPVAIRFFSKYKNDPDYIAWFSKKLERLAACLHITGGNVNARIDRYARVIEEIKKTESSADNPLKTIELTKEEQAAFLQALDGDIYGLSSNKRKYAVLRLDSFVSDSGVTYDNRNLTMEHVLPQTKTSEWKSLWADDDLWEHWLNRIANLVPLAQRQNSKAQNYVFNEKKKVYSEINKATPYALTTQVLLKTEWIPKVVVDRQQELMDTYMKKWELFEGQKIDKKTKAPILDSVKRHEEVVDKQKNIEEKVSNNHT